MDKSPASSPSPIRRVFVLLSAPTHGRKPSLLKNLGALEEAGFEVVLLDTSAIFFPQWRGQRNPELSVHHVIPISHSKEFLSLVGQFSERDTVIITGYWGSIRSPQHFQILRSLGKSGARIGFIAVGNLPKFSRRTLMRYKFSEIRVAKGTGLPRMLGTLFLQALASIVSKGLTVFWSQLTRLFLTAKIDFVWAGVEVPQSLMDLTSKKTAIRYIHNLDFDLVLESSTPLDLSIPTNTVLWLDSMGPFHPDVNFPGYRYRFPDQWIEEHSWAIKMIEDFFSTEIVVAAHPKSNTDSERALYGNRRILRNALYPAILGSQLVISTGSTAIALVAYARKPILLFDSTFELALGRAVIDSQSQALGAKRFSRNNPIVSHEVAVCEPKYDSFVREYLKKPNTADTKFWNQVSADLV